MSATEIEISFDVRPLFSAGKDEIIVPSEVFKLIGSWRAIARPRSRLRIYKLSKHFVGTLFRRLY